jgi:hypothetical protein
MLHIAEDEPGDNLRRRDCRCHEPPVALEALEDLDGGQHIRRPWTRADLHVSIHDAGCSVTAWKSGGCCSAASTRGSISRSAGLGGRVHPQIAWAKLDTLVKGAELATSQLWG